MCHNFFSYILLFPLEVGTQQPVSGLHWSVRRICTCSLLEELVAQIYLVCPWQRVLYAVTWIFPLLWLKHVNSPEIRNKHIILIKKYLGYTYDFYNFKVIYTNINIFLISFFIAILQRQRFDKFLHFSMFPV